MILFLTGYLKGINLFILLGYVLFSMWLVNGRLAFVTLRALRGTIALKELAFAGQPVDLRLELHTNSSKSIRGIRLTSEKLCWFIARLDPGQILTLRFQHIFAKRGRQSTVAVCARTCFPFGLAALSVELFDVESWIVAPRIGLLHLEGFKQWLACASRGDGRSRQSVHSAMQGADLHGLRDFRPGDSPRWIHWRSSARRDQMLVREFEENSSVDLMLIVETWVPPQPSELQLRRLEEMLELAATIAYQWCRHPRARLGLVVDGAPESVLPLRSGLAHGVRALEMLAVVDGASYTGGLKWLPEQRDLAVAYVCVLTTQPNSPCVQEVSRMLHRSVANIRMGDAISWYQAPLEA